MRVALISDIHGNFVSFEAVLEDIAKNNVDQIICLGDVATTGPQPRECVSLLRSMGCVGIIGNHEDYLLNAEKREKSRWADTLNWCLEQLSEDDLDYLRAFRPWSRIELDKNNDLLCFHGSPKSNLDLIMPTTTDEALKEMLTGHSATIMAGGHTHIQLLRQYKNSLVINAGSVGLPFDHYLPQGDEKRVVPWAEYTIVTCLNGSVSVDFRRVPIDFEEIKRASQEADNPFDWIPQWFTQDEL